MSQAFDIAIAARTLAQEARGEPPAGQNAVAWVLRNRWAARRWGLSLASVCLWHAQFSGWYVATDPNFAYACNIAEDDPVLLAMTAIIKNVMAADRIDDPTGGALFYHANNMPVPPAWAATMRFLGVFGHQSFYTDQSAPITVSA